MERRMMEQDDIFEYYDVLNSLPLDMTRACLARASPRKPDKGFLCKYGVGVKTSGFHAQKGGDTTNPSYWLRRMGLIEVSSASSSKRSAAATSISSHASIQLAGGGGGQQQERRRRRSSSRRRKPTGGASGATALSNTAATARLRHQVSMPAAWKGSCGVVAGQVVSDENDWEDRAVEGKVELEVAEAGPRSVTGSDDGSAQMGSLPESRFGGAEVGSETGESSWSLASATSSFSVLSALNLEALPSEESPPQQVSVLPLKGRGYRHVLLHSDSEHEI